MQEAVNFYSWGCKIAGVLHIPDNYAPGQRRPAVVMSHGMANDRDESGQHTFLDKKLEEMDYEEELGRILEDARKYYKKKGLI